jgi:hypothetical protein
MMSSFNFDSLSPKYLKKDSITRLYNTINENLELKDSSIKCVETTAFYNGLYFIVVYPSHPNAKTNFMDQYQKGYFTSYQNIKILSRALMIDKCGIFKFFI